MTIKRALIVTVGTGTRPDVYIVKPLVKTIKDSRPDFLVLVVTERSRTYGEAIIRELVLKDESYLLEELRDFDDFQAVFRDINRVFRRLTAMGYGCEQIQIDFTSGTKAMSSGAVLSAVYNECRSLKYITGQRKNGVVVDGSEKYLTVQPSGIFALHEIHLARELIIRLRFSTASEILGKLNFDLLDPHEKQWAENLELVVQAYRAWDNFDHHSALKKLKKVDWKLAALQRFRPAPAGEAMLLEVNKADKKKQDELLLLDLYNNSLRRGLEGKYDDAVARLYRATELLAQQILAQPPFEIRTEDVDLSRVPASIRSRLEKNRDDTDGQVRIGLVLDYELLSELEHSVGRHFVENVHIKDRLRERNESILAHGTKPVSKSVYEKLRSSILELFRLEIPDFEEKAAGIQFPWLPIEA